MDRDHRRRQHDPFKPQPRHRGVAKQDVAAHRMGKPDERRRAIRQHDVLHEADEIAVVFPEAAHMALARVGQHPLRASLAAPIHGRHGKAPAAQIRDDLEVFLDELGAAAEQADGAPPRHARRVPARVAKLRAVVAAEGSDGRPAGNGIFRERDEFHCFPPDGPNSPRHHTGSRATATVRGSVGEWSVVRAGPETARAATISWAVAIDGPGVHDLARAAVDRQVEQPPRGTPRLHHDHTTPRLEIAGNRPSLPRVVGRGPLHAARRGRVRRSRGG